jgi:hypothetical protein
VRLHGKNHGLSRSRQTDGDRNCAICKLGYHHLGECEVCSEDPSSSVSIVSGYGLDDRAIEVLSSAGAEDFSCSLCVQTGSGAHPASCTMGTGGPFPGGVTLTSHPCLVPRSRMSRSYASSTPPSAFMTCSGTALALAFRSL